ncbi:MAG: ABC transporter ATP-binding protein [Magnetococcales bacterium]|nr:ABC transporter ATP-binding protein [Magnetococcales bacterium]
MVEQAICFRNVEKSFADKRVLSGVDFSVDKGEFFAFVGANGQGKTTLIKAMLDFIELDGGEIEIFGCSHRLTKARQPLAYLPERFNPPHFLSGRDFIKYMMKLHQHPYDEEQLLNLFQQLDLDSRVLSQSVRTFSKGMTQKLGLSGCLLSGKPLLILDEPMSGLDPKARVLFKRHLMRLKEAGTSLFFSTHLLPDVEELCDRMAIIHQGRVHFIGSPKGCRDLYPAESLEASFIRCIESG